MGNQSKEDAKTSNTPLLEEQSPKNQEKMLDLIKRFERAEEMLRRFGDMDDLIASLRQIEEKIYVCKTFLTTDEAASLLGINKRTLLNAAQRGEIKLYNPPSRHYYFKREELNEWINGFVMMNPAEPKYEEFFGK
ncbi:MAG: helix-turn-helix domain-containing protein [Parabacteroides sp.]|nr:helix-turn-helix domain-containing protein [Bacteroides sp.]MDY4757687.1 helix-turn-helix domain-containing protein [Parabacteroides sp.]